MAESIGSTPFNLPFLITTEVFWRRRPAGPSARQTLGSPFPISSPVVYPADPGASKNFGPPPDAPAPVTTSHNSSSERTLRTASVTGEE